MPGPLACLETQRRPLSMLQLTVRNVELAEPGCRSLDLGAHRAMGIWHGGKAMR